MSGVVLERGNSRDVQCTVFERAFDSLTDALLITDSHGVVLRTNHKACELFPHDSALHLPFWNVLGLKCFDLDSALEQITKSCLTPGSPEKTYVCKATGALFDIRLVRLDENEAQGPCFLLILHEITYLSTYRAQLESQIRERTMVLERSQKLLQTVFQGVGKGVVLVDDELEVVESNQKACEIFGRNENNIVGANILSLCRGEDQPHLADLLYTLEDYQITSKELTGVYFDKSTFPAVFTVSSISHNNQKFWIVITEDISEQKRLQQQLLNEKVRTDEANITLRNVLKNIQDEKNDLAGRISRVVVNDILPALHRLGAEARGETSSATLRYVESLLASLTSGTNIEVSPAVLRLSKTELKVCRLIQSGLGSKEICSEMNLSFDTIQTHRRNIRKKLGLSGSRDVSLYGYLSTCNL